MIDTLLRSIDMKIVDCDIELQVVEILGVAAESLEEDQKWENFLQLDGRSKEAFLDEYLKSGLNY